MRLGYVLRYHPTRSETFVDREIAELRRRGFQVDVVGLGLRGDAPDDPETLRPPRGLDPRWGSGPASPSGRRALRAGRSMGAKGAGRAAWLAALAERRRWDRVVVHFAGEAAALALLAAEAVGIPCQITTHAVDLFRPRPDLAAMLRAADPLVTVCDHHRRFIADHHGLRAEVVRCGVPLDVPRADPATSRQVVCVARDVPKKGLDQLVATTRALGARLRLVSDAHRLGGPGVVVGPSAPHEVPAVLAKGAVFALPCRVAEDGDRDGLPVAVLEAMAAALPVVTTDVAGLPEAVDERTGWRVPAGDPAAFAAALRDALASPEERVRRGDQGRIRLEERGWTVTSQVDSLCTLWTRPPAHRRNVATSPQPERV
ncbi:MAG: glycosyltransferase family 4 protein [Alphaproteobacteria bacterium]|nr:glycosyltransferase family 4 protein [Alphaproteobacteria bacterium]MCB9697855.1 glycosyltransferase family 4 protein [Alphaproteobacteria bacterium]